MIFSHIINSFNESDWTGPTAWKSIKYLDQDFPNTSPWVWFVAMRTDSVDGFDNTGNYDNTKYAYFPTTYPASIRLRVTLRVQKITSATSTTSPMEVFIGRCNAAATALTGTNTIIDLAPLAAGIYDVDWEGSIYLDGNSTDGRGVALGGINLIGGYSVFRINGGLASVTGYTT